jgi:hypothetical protein
MSESQTLPLKRAVSLAFVGPLGDSFGLVINHKKDVDDCKRCSRN